MNHLKRSTYSQYKPVRSGFTVVGFLITNLYFALSFPHTPPCLSPSLSLPLTEVNPLHLQTAECQTKCCHSFLQLVLYTGLSKL